MERLAEVLVDTARCQLVIADAAELVNQQVQAKGGLSGMALKAGYRTVLAIRPGIIHDVLSSLLPEFAPIVDPFLESARKEGNVRKYFEQHANTIADALLGVTDRRSARAKNAVIKRAYEGLRPMAKRNTAEAVPALADLITKHVKD